MSEIRFDLTQHASRAGHSLPDVMLAALFAYAAAVQLFPGRFAALSEDVQDNLAMIVFVEGGFLMMQAALIDIATRLRKRPHIVVALLITAALALFLGFGMLRMAWAQGLAVFLPLLLSLGERASVLWRMPGRARIEKIAARALVSNRITTGMAMLALMAVGMFIADDVAVVFLIAAALYYSIAAIDSWRVRGRRFAEKPRVLFGFDPIRIQYLEPV